MKTTVPRFLVDEHREIRRELARAVEAGGKTGEAARNLSRVLLPHMEREDRLALPPLGILEDLARRTGPLDPSAVLRHHEALVEALPELLREHGFIVGALEALEAAARAEKRETIAALSQRLIHHARLEEEILYPAAVLVGEYLKLADPE